MSKRKLCLFPEGAYQGLASLAAAQGTTSLTAEFPQVGGTEIGERVILEVAPDVLDRIELGCIGGQLGEDDVAIRPVNPLSNHLAAVDRQAVPDDQQGSTDLAPQVRKELPCLGPANRTGIQAKIELGPSDAGDYRQLLPT